MPKSNCLIGKSNKQDSRLYGKFYLSLTPPSEGYNFLLEI